MSAWPDHDTHFMQLALNEAATALQRGEIPVGAVVVRNGEAVGRGHNLSVTNSDPTAHAEIVAIRDAAARERNYRLPGAEIYVTLEPCVMCIGAMLHARISRLVFGAYDKKAGAAGSVLDLADLRSINHRIEINGGLLQEKCGAILLDFFASRR